MVFESFSHLGFFLGPKKVSKSARTIGKNVMMYENLNTLEGIFFMVPSRGKVNECQFHA